MLLTSNSSYNWRYLKQSCSVRVILWSCKLWLEYFGYRGRQGVVTQPNKSGAEPAGHRFESCHLIGIMNVIDKWLSEHNLSWFQVFRSCAKSCLFQHHTCTIVYLLLFYKLLRVSCRVVFLIFTSENTGILKPGVCCYSNCVELIKNIA